MRERGRERDGGRGREREPQRERADEVFEAPPRPAPTASACGPPLFFAILPDEKFLTSNPSNAASRVAAPPVPGTEEEDATGGRAGVAGPAEKRASIAAAAPPAALGLGGAVPAGAAAPAGVGECVVMRVLARSSSAGWESPSVVTRWAGRRARPEKERVGGTGGGGAANPTAALAFFFRARAKRRKASAAHSHPGPTRAQRTPRPQDPRLLRTAPFKPPHREVGDNGRLGCVAQQKNEKNAATPLARPRPRPGSPPGSGAAFRVHG